MFFVDLPPAQETEFRRPKSRSDVSAWHSPCDELRVIRVARQIAEEATTRAMKTRLLDEAEHFERLAADADRGMGETVSP
jgi:hypothetical protein